MRPQDLVKEYDGTKEFHCQKPITLGDLYKEEYAAVKVELLLNLRTHLLKAVAVSDTSDGSSDKIYLAREGQVNRTLVSSDAVELEDILKKAGFKKLVPDNLTFAEQIKMMSGVKEVVALHGPVL